MKKMFRFLMATATFVSATFVMATAQSVTGLVQTAQQQPATFVPVGLRKASDSAKVANTLSDSLGHYHFLNIAPGQYFTVAGSSKTSRVFSSVFSVKKESKINLPTLTIAPTKQHIKEVKINAVKPVIEHFAGKTVVNVANTSLSAGNTIMQVLKKSPGVTVDQNDNISLDGKGGVKVMINGRPTHLATAQLAMILKSTSASTVSKIELMTQPPAKYSAEGTGGIINIILQKHTALGFNGDVTAGLGYGQYWTYNGGTNLNYRGKKLSVYGSYNYSHRKRRLEMDITRRFLTPGTSDLENYMQQVSKIHVNNDNQTAQLGLDYNINKKQSIGFVLNGGFNNGDFYSNSPVEFRQASGDLDSVSTSQNHDGYNWQNESGNVHYNIDLGKKGSALTLNADYSHFYQSMPQSIITKSVDGDGTSLGNDIQRQGKQPNDIKIYAAKADYTSVLGHQYKLEAGLKTSFVKTDNQSIFSISDGGLWHNDVGLTNHFVYKENVNAAYLTLSKRFKKGWSAKAGVRSEQSNIKTHQLLGDSSNTSNYLDFFPNISIAKTINANNVLSLSYTRRIDRPNYRSLNPFTYYVDEYTYRVGNPYLKPQYTGNVELGYTFKRKYSAVLGYSHTRDIISEVVRQNLTTHKLFQTKDNISRLDHVTLNFNVPVKITSWWQTYNTAILFYDRYQGLYDGFDLNKGYASFMVRTYQSFILPNHWKAELSGFYRSGMIMGPIIVDPMGMVSAGVERSFWKGKATIKLNVNDIFQTMNFSGQTDFGNLHLQSAFYGYSRAANLTFTWNFGNQKVKVQHYKNTGIKKEEGRIKQGSGAGKM